MNRNQNQGAAASAAQTEDRFFDLHTKGYGYLSRVRVVPVGKNKRDTFLACTVAALYGQASDVSYSYYDLKVVGKEAQDLVRKLGLDIAKKRKVLVAFRAGDTYAEPYEKIVDGKTELRAVTKGRLLQITLAKVDGEVVYRDRAEDEAPDSGNGHAAAQDQGDADAGTGDQSEASDGAAAPAPERSAQRQEVPSSPPAARRTDSRDRTRVRSYPADSVAA